ncbi:MAG: DUF2508 family protein [Lachnospiraceae bacterium]|nr:DUF2508 family protein [Lachnospiraceae bacterium]
MKILFRQSPCQLNTEDSLELQKISIHEELLQAKRALEDAYAGFDNVTNPDLIDCYIFELNAVMKRYKFLLEEASRINLIPKETIDETYNELSLLN